MSERLDIEAIKARCEAATPGPWVRGKSGDYDIVRQAEWAPCGVEGHDNCAVARTYHQHVAMINQWHDIQRVVNDTEFIAHARTDIPALLARIAELEAGLAPFTHLYDWVDPTTEDLTRIVLRDGGHKVNVSDFLRADALLASPPAQEAQGQEGVSE